MTSYVQDLFDAAYVMPGVEGYRRLIRLYDQGLHDFREKLAEKEMVHRAIVVYLTDKLYALAQQMGDTPC